ncbi:MAG TPA: hypothetical protein PK605_00300 [Ignavibacteria bacterium]|nr:hypothetical protein [Bacteroidota bacterium]HRE10779.1 hypothetical protein [Ignavibacteria bacterium]HRF65978.1 hypothetical protein [Ignavibacteria bacterium]HRJ02819.1 hypothetical protein [Ignavibacteria bacterium]HRJ84377.1 hypothetical protein [Ignavibacteria bacterium]
MKSEETIKAEKALGINLHEPNFDIYALPVDKEELRLIKLALFEISEYLGSPRLTALRQRVNSMMAAQPVKLPTESIFNNDVFQGGIIYTKMGEVDV